MELSSWKIMKYFKTNVDLILLIPFLFIPLIGTERIQFFHLDVNVIQFTL